MGLLSKGRTPVRNRTRQYPGSCESRNAASRKAAARSLRARSFLNSASAFAELRMAFQFNLELRRALEYLWSKHNATVHGKARHLDALTGRVPRSRHGSEFRATSRFLYYLKCVSTSTFGAFTPFIKFRRKV